MAGSTISQKENIMKKIINLIVAVSLLGLFACEAEITNNSKSENLVGTWYMSQKVNAKTFNKSASDISNGALSSWNYETVITTNSDQNANDLYSEGTGGIEVSGSESVTFTYMYPYQYTDEFTGNTLLFAYLTDHAFTSYKTEYPIYGMSLQKGPKWDQDSVHAGTGLWVQKDDSTFVDYLGNVDFSYDGKSLTVEESTLREYESDRTVTLKGTLTHKMISVPANTPTVINSFSDNNVSLDQGGWTIEIRDNGEWIEKYQWEEWSDSLVAAWEVDGDILKVTYDFFGWNSDSSQSNHASYEYVIEFNFKIENNELLLNNKYHICGDDFTQDCLAWFEDDYGLDRGSLESIIDRMSLTFSQTPESSSKMMVYEPGKIARRKMVAEINAFLNKVQQ